jgi:DNA-binding XRE family transcriptional regulator
MDFRTLRQRKQLAVGELAKLSGVKRQTIYQLESGINRNPTIKTVSRLAPVLGVTAEVVFRAIAETDGLT